VQHGSVSLQIFGFASFSQKAAQGCLLFTH
jgi:hypothetical protein